MATAIVLVALLLGIGVALTVGTDTTENQLTADSSNASVSTDPSVVSSSTEDARPPPSSESKKPDEGSTTNNTWLILALFVLTITTLISVSISFYLYRWRRILLASPHMLVPEKLGELLAKLSKVIERHAHVIDTNFQRIGQQSSETGDKVSNLVETFMTMQGALDEREAEIRRLKRGYDAEIFRKFVLRFIRVNQTVEDLQKDGNATSDDLELVRRLLEDAFAECGVESFEPEIGSDYREAQGVADNPKTVSSENPDDAFKIVEVLEAGHRVRGPESDEIILPAKVKIYTVKTEEM